MFLFGNYGKFFLFKNDLFYSSWLFVSNHYVGIYVFVVFWWNFIVCFVNNSNCFNVNYFQFLEECIQGFSKASIEMKHLCLEYMTPWLPNLEKFVKHTDDSKRHKVSAILDKLITTTINENQASKRRHLIMENLPLVRKIITF